MLYDIRKNATWIAVEKAKRSIAEICANRRTLGLICGGTGIGKTALTRMIARRHRIKSLPEDRPETVEAMVSMTWQNREWPVHVLNECDHILRNEESINVVKLMHEAPRRVVHFTKEARQNEEFLEYGSRQYRPSIAPTSFDLDHTCRQLFLTNTNFTDRDIARQLPQEHWMALLRRNLKPVFIPTPDAEVFRYTLWGAREDHMLQSHQFDWPTSRDAVGFYIKNRNRLPELSPARLISIAEIIRDSPRMDDRQQALDDMLFADQRDLALDATEVQVLLWPRRAPRRRPRQHTPQPASTPAASEPPPEPPPSPHPRA